MGFLVVVIAIIMIATVIHIFSIIAILILIVMMGEEEALMIVQWCEMKDTDMVKRQRQRQS